VHAVSQVVDRSAYAHDGWIVVPGLLSRAEAGALAERAASLVEHNGSVHVSPDQIQTEYNRRGRAQLLKINQVTLTDPVFSALASRPAIVDVVEELLGPGARIFRDVLIVKPAQSSGIFSYHQDSAYWDVDPPSLVSCWLALTDVPEEASCLRVIRRSHDRPRRHGILVGGRPLPHAAVAALRKIVSYAGTGDNPGEAGGSLALWSLKRRLFRASRFLPVMASLRDYRALPSEVDLAREVKVPVRAGDAIFFHSLLLHATGPNQATAARYTPIISYMARDARFVGKGSASFRRARQGQL
jgi:ectoine hydroxylase-related dioxygenase (phytanoyl-CoA dioxygenase family)